MAEFDAGVGGGELPLDLALVGVGGVLPGGEFGVEGVDVGDTAIEALAGMEAVVGWRGAPRPVHATELLPERALLGDRAAIEALNEYLVLPLAAAGSSLSDTLDAYLDCGGAVETCARQLYVHPNTVRYRLKRIGEVTGRDPMNPRDAYVLRIAATVGRLTRTHNESSPPVTETPPIPMAKDPL